MSNPSATITVFKYRIPPDNIRCDKCKLDRPMFDDQVNWCRQCVLDSARTIRCVFCNKYLGTQFGFKPSQDDGGDAWQYQCCHNCETYHFFINRDDEVDDPKNKSVVWV